MALHSDDDRERDGGEASDADSDLEELQGDIAKFDESVREFLASHRGGSSQASRGGTRGRGPRGPRKAAKPRGDITARLSKVNQAFLGGDYTRALDLVFEVIRINAETHQAWTALSSIFREQGELNRALSAMVYAAHLRPKDVSGWMGCASFALDTIEGDESGNLHTARLCYSAALRADHGNLDARIGKATVCHRQGHFAAAISEYNTVLKKRPQDLGLVRKLAEASLDNKQLESAVPSAISAYRRYFNYQITTRAFDAPDPPWHDISIYVDLFSAVGRYHEAIHELKALARWLVGRGKESYWDEWQDDDREWDESDNRRSLVPGFVCGSPSSSLYGQALPHDLRAKLGIYRLKLGHEDEALKHLAWLQAADQHTQEFAEDFPFLAYELASELVKHDQPVIAIEYLKLLQAATEDTDSVISLQLGRCYLATGEQSMAEECFLAAIDADEDSIEARVELANMYEKAKEDEEALILAAEAMALRGAQESTRDYAGNEGMPLGGPADTASHPLTQRRAPGINMNTQFAKSGGRIGNPVIPRRYRPKRLAGPDKRQQDEQARAIKLSHQYEIVRDLKRKIISGRDDLIAEWMRSSKELVDDFRSLKRFYTWDKYLHFLGSKLQHPSSARPESELSQMYERLARSVAPNTTNLDIREQQRVVFDTHQGISFDDWLDLFLDYAIGLAISHRRDEAYQVCQAAKDSTVFQSSSQNFSIYVAWSVCAIYTNDEERCVSTARHLMRDGAVSDSYRMFALLSKLCQSPVSWYTSGPAQKYILRQIKAIDASHQQIEPQNSSNVDDSERSMSNLAHVNIDICLLMLYGHILFTSTSYTYALGYFLRARSLDPSNPMINLSLGLAYVHYGLKRQSTNRQYLLLQGQAFLTRYSQANTGDNMPSMAERYYNIGRLFQLLGISHLSSRYYAEALSVCGDSRNDADIRSIIIFNSAISFLLVQNQCTALLLVKKYLRI